MVDRDRVAILWVPYEELVGLLAGKSVVDSLPSDAAIDDAYVDFARMRIGLRVRSNCFLITVPGEPVKQLHLLIKPVDAGFEMKTNKGEDWHSVMRRWEEEFRLLQAAYPSQNKPLQEVGA